MGKGVRCSLCTAELGPGECYFRLEGQAVCEACLERYARGRFARQLRRVEGREGEGELDDL